VSQNPHFAESASDFGEAALAKNDKVWQLKKEINDSFNAF